MTSMIEFVTTLKCAMRKMYKFPLIKGSKPENPLFEVADGVYPVEMDGTTYMVRVKNDRMSWTEVRKPKKQQKNKEKKQRRSKKD